MKARPVAASAAEQRHETLMRYLPIALWLPRYRASDLPGDVTAGVVVAIMLVPQAMAYALLAGLPPEVGLYASVAPLVLYAVFGSSRSMAVGPTALVSLLVATTVARFAAEGVHPVALVATLAALVGALQLTMGLLRLGFLVNLLSQPVVAGFTGAAALIIALSQMSHLAGIRDVGHGKPHEMLVRLLARWHDASLPTLGVAAGSLLVLWVFRARLGSWLRRRGMKERVADAVAKAGPLAAVVAAMVVTWALDLPSRHGVAVVGAVPVGLPMWSAPGLPLEIAGDLALAALTIAFVSFMESISIAKVLAGKHRQPIRPNVELRAFGAANLAAAFTGGYPVSSGLSRSIVNHSTGARTALASLVTAALVGATLLFFTPLFRFLPQATLAAVVLVAILGLVDGRAAGKLYRYSRADFSAYALTAIVVFLVGVQEGVAVGVAASLLLFLWRASHPHLAVLGRVGQTEHYRNILNYPVETCPHVLAVRIDESLFFANTKFLEENLLRLAAAQPGITDLILVCSAVNAIDASALETLERLDGELREAGVRFHLAEVKGPVMARLIRAGFADRFGPERIHLSTYQAMIALGCGGGRLQETTLAS
jgi:sulfate permease, SulP family